MNIATLLTSSKGFKYNKKTPHEKLCEKPLTVMKNNTSILIFSIVISDSCLIGTNIKIKKNNERETAPINVEIKVDKIYSNILSILSKTKTLVVNEKINEAVTRKSN
ncbi:MAG: hypothetical protein LBJ26_07055 [Paenibacillus sp.]|nr:hypothetical protein [Paenibacillus sp.]